MGDHVTATAADDVRALLDAIRRIVQSLHASSRESQMRIGLSAAQLFVLRSLKGAEGLSINDLARATFTHQSSVSAVVSRLEARGLVTRRRDRTDARRRVIALTPAGQRALRSAPGATQELLVEAVVTMSPTARRTTARALARLADAMAARRRPSMFLEPGGPRG